MDTVINMDLVDLIVEKRFLGQEFLTWLWFKSDERGGTVYVPDHGDVQVLFERHLLLESSDEGDQLGKVICQGPQAELQEARTGLAVGKKLEQARMVIRRGDHEWRLSLKGSMLEYRSVRPPKTMSQSEESDDPAAREGLILDRIGLFETLARIIDDLFRLYLASRLSDGWPGELEKIRAWTSRDRA